jgi:hypothetical protein
LWRLKSSSLRTDSSNVDILPATEPPAPPSPVADWLTSFALHGPFQRFLVMAIPSGVLFGLFTGARALSLRAGIASGVFFALLFGISMTAIVESRLKPLRALPRWQQIEVTTAVRRGTKPVDRALAAPILTYAAIVCRSQGSPATARRLSRAFAAGAAFSLLAALTHPKPNELTVDAIIVILLIRQAVNGPKRRDRVLANATRAEAAARALLAHNTS